MELIFPIIEYETICKDLQYGGFTSVNMKSKIISLKCYWVKKLPDEIFQGWKIVSLTLVKNAFGKCFIFYYNMERVRLLSST